MARRLGEILIQSGVIDERQLEEALRTQRIFGGSLGSTLLQLGYLSERELANALSRLFSAPAVMREDLMHAPVEAIDLLPEDFCRKHRGVPFRVEGHRLLLALQNPNDGVATHEAAFLTGLQVVPHVAVELALRDAIAFHYNADPMPRDDVRRSASGDGEDGYVTGPTDTGGVTGVPNPTGETGETGESEETGRTGKVDATGPDRAGHDTDPRQRPAAPAAPGPKRAADGSPTFRGIPSDPRTTGEVPLVQKPGRTPSPRIAATTGPLSILRDTPPPRTTGPNPALSPPPLAGVGRALAVARQRDEVLTLLLKELSAHMPRSVLFLWKKDHAVAWRAKGVALPSSGPLQIDLRAASVLDSIRNGQLFHYGPVEMTPANEDLFTVLGGAAPRVALVLGVVVKTHPVVALYGDDPDGDAPPPDFQVMKQLSSLGSWALEALVLRRKILRESGALEVSGGGAKNGGDQRKRGST